MSAERDLLSEIKENRIFAETEWSDARAEAAKDRLCETGRIWEAMDPDALKERKDNKRPFLNSDEINQYLNQTVNGVRSNPRGIKFAATGNGANDIGAEFYENHTREIEYRSKASIVYANAFQHCVGSGVGWLRIKAKREHLRTFNQDLWIEFIANPDQVLPDPSGVWPDSRDIKFLYFIEPWSRKEFERRFPKAKASSFTLDTSRNAPGWLDRNRVDVGEYWKLESLTRRLVAYRPKGSQEGDEQTALMDELPDGKLPEGMDNIREEDVDDTTVKSWLTNGLEILKEQSWTGKYIPFVSCTAKVIYVEGKRVVLSMTRLARDPAMYHAYALTCGAEAIGGVPRAQYVGYEGQFAKPERWAQSNRKPVAFTEAKAQTAETPPGTILPLPQRQSWDPPIQNVELVIEARRRSIQAAMGITPQPTDAQRRNDVSGVAWKERQAQGQIGSYHFVDAYELMVERTGMILEDQMDKRLDTARDVPVRKANDESAILTINNPAGSVKDEQGQLSGDPIFTKGDYRVTITTGPATESQRQEGSEFVDSLLEQLPEFAQILGPQKTGQLVAMGIKFKQLGPIGDEMEALFAPPPMMGPNGKPLSPEMQRAMQEIQHLQQENQQLKQNIQTHSAEKQVEMQGKTQITQIQEMHADQRAALEREKAIAVAEINAQAKQALQDMALFYEERGRIGAQIHEHAMGTKEIASNVALAHHAAVEGVKDRVHEHLQNEADRQHAMDLTTQQAALQPDPTQQPEAGA